MMSDSDSDADDLDDLKIVSNPLKRMRSDSDDETSPSNSQRQPDDSEEENPAHPPSSSSSSSATTVPPKSKKSRLSWTKKTELKYVQDAKDRCKTEDLFWSKGYTGAKNVWFPCTKVNLDDLELSTRASLERQVSVRGGSVTQSVDGECLVWFMPHREEATSLQYERVVEKDLVPFVPNDDKFKELEKSRRKAKTKSEKAVANCLSDALKIAVSVYEKAFEREEQERLREEKERVADKEELAKQEEERKKALELAQKEEAARLEQLKNLPDIETLETQDKSVLTLHAGDLIMLRCKIEKTYVKAKVCIVSEDSIELDMPVSGSPWIGLTDDCRIHRVIPPEQLQSIFNLDARPSVIYITPILPIKEFQSIPGQVEGSHSSQIVQNVAAANEELRMCRTGELEMSETAAGTQETIQQQTQQEPMQLETQENIQQESQEASEESTQQTVPEPIPQETQESIKQDKQESIQEPMELETPGAIEKSTQQSTQEIIQETVQKETQESMEKPVEKSTQQLAEMTTSLNPTQQNTQKTVQETILQETQESIQEPIEKATQQGADETTIQEPALEKKEEIPESEPQTSPENIPDTKAHSTIEDFCSTENVKSNEKSIESTNEGACPVTTQETL